MHQSQALTDKEHAESIIGDYIAHYNHRRLHSAIGYVAPADRLAGRDVAIRTARAAKLKAAAAERQKARQA